MSVGGLNLVHAGSRRVALITTAIVAAGYVLISVAVVLIVTYNLTVGIDKVLASRLTIERSFAAGQRPAPPGVVFLGPGEPRFGPPVLLWRFFADGTYIVRGLDAEKVDLPVPYRSVTAQPRTINVSGTGLRVMGGQVGNDWVVVGQSMTSVYRTRSNLIFAEALIAPVLLAIVFLGALAIGRRVATPVEEARQRQMEFTANASHELRTPLSVIQAQATLALAQPRDAGWYERAFVRVDQESRRMRRLVDDLLWLARFDARRDGARAEPVDVAVVAQQTVDRFMTIAETRQLRLSLQVAGDSHVIAAAPEWLDHLVGVLVDNACKYTPAAGWVEVRVAAEGDRVRLSVDDSGPGIPPDERARIFDRFHRATAKPEGAGIGLAIADAVVGATNGRWQIGQSTAGGASMAVIWPRLLASSAAPVTAPVVRARPQPGS